MADNLGPMAWLFLPENVQVQYLQKIAQMRRKSGRALFSARSAYFLKPIGGFNFPAKSPLLERETRPFSPNLNQYYLVDQVFLAKPFFYILKGDLFLF